MKLKHGLILILGFLLIQKNYSQILLDEITDHTFKNVIKELNIINFPFTTDSLIKYKDIPLVGDKDTLITKYFCLKGNCHSQYWIKGIIKPDVDNNYLILLYSSSYNERYFIYLSVFDLSGKLQDTITIYESSIFYGTNSDEIEEIQRRSSIDNNFNITVKSFYTYTGYKNKENYYCFEGYLDTSGYQIDSNGKIQLINKDITTKNKYSTQYKASEGSFPEYVPIK